VSDAANQENQPKEVSKEAVKETSVKNAPIQSREKKGLSHSPFAGCLIGVIVMLVIGFLFAFAIWSFFRLDKEIGKFTEEQAWEMPELQMDPAGSESLKKKLDEMKSFQGQDRGGEVRLSAGDLNTMIATYEGLKEYRSSLHVDEITAEKMLIRIAFPMNESPLSDKKRYLNGIMTARPELVETEVEEERNSDHEVVLRVETIKTATGAPVPDGFLGHFSPLRITERFLTNQEARPYLRTIQGVRIEEGAVVLALEPTADSPAVQVSDIRPYRNRFLLVFGIVAMGVISAITLGLIFQKKRKENS